MDRKAILKELLSFAQSSYQADQLHRWFEKRLVTMTVQNAYYDQELVQSRDPSLLKRMRKSDNKKELIDAASHYVNYTERKENHLNIMEHSITVMKHD